MKLQKFLLGALLSSVACAHVNGNENAANADQAPLINSLYQREWVSLDPNGSITGRVVVVEHSGAVSGRIDNKVILSRDGVAAYEAKTGEEGVFEFKNVEPGTYALQTVGDYTFAAFALHVLPAGEKHLASSLDIFATTVGAKLKELIASTVVPADLEFGQDDYYRTHKVDPIANERVFNRDHQVLLQNGALVGRVSRPGWTYAEQDLTGTVAQVLKNGNVVAHAAVAADGYYQIENLAPGIYDMIISGNDGFAAFRFQAVNEIVQPEAVASNGTSQKLVSARLVKTEVADSLNTELISQADVTVAEPVAAAAPELGVPCDTCGPAPVDSCGCGSAPVYGGGFAGGGGFGGGGFGGGAGGLGGLLGIGGLAAGIVAIATSGGDDPSPATPIQ